MGERVTQRSVRRPPWVVAAVPLGRRAMPEAWQVTPLSEHEVSVGERLAGQLTGGNSDAGRLFDRFAGRGYQLVAAPRKGNPGGGHRARGTARRRGIDLWRSAFGRAVYRCRVGMEGAFGNATSFAAGLGRRPAWVRRLGRVQRWVGCTLVINAACEPPSGNDLRHDCNKLARVGLTGSGSDGVVGWTAVPHAAGRQYGGRSRRKA